MLRLTLADCARALDAELRADGASGVGDGVVTGIGIDTRTLPPGALWVALRGARDGHEFVASAEAAGAAAALVERPLETSLPQLVVADTRLALAALARHWAERHQVPTVAITGSNGKTTTRELLAAILGELGPVLATDGNLNNDLGVPLTLCRLGPEHRYAVIELGANAPGEIATLAAIARPDVGVITNAGPAHLEGFGSVAGVARAKSELFAALAADGSAVVNADDAHVDVFRAAAAHCGRCEFGHAPGADVRATDDEAFVVVTRGERLVIPFALPGEHNRANALAAIAAARCLDVQADAIVAGLAGATPVTGRLASVASRSGAALFDDTYNANPSSTHAAIAVLAARPGRRHLVLGDMGELGHDGEALHARVGEAAHEAGLDGLWTHGPLAAAAGRAWHRLVGGRMTSGADAGLRRDARGAHFADIDALVASLEPHLDADATVLVKGSRAARMERVVAALAPEARP